MLLSIWRAVQHWFPQDSGVNITAGRTGQRRHRRPHPDTEQDNLPAPKPTARQIDSSIDVCLPLGHVHPAKISGRIAHARKIETEHIDTQPSQPFPELLQGAMAADVLWLEGVADDRHAFARPLRRLENAEQRPLTGFEKQWLERHQQLSVVS
jgi:hypothetical protein